MTRDRYYSPGDVLQARTAHGLVLRDGTRWGVMAHRLNDKGPQ